MEGIQQRVGEDPASTCSSVHSPRHTIRHPSYPLIPFPSALCVPVSGLTHSCCRSHCRHSLVPLPLLLLAFLPHQAQHPAPASSTFFPLTSSPPPVTPVTALCHAFAACHSLSVLAPPASSSCDSSQLIHLDTTKVLGLSDMDLEAAREKERVAEEGGVEKVLLGYLGRGWDAASPWLFGSWGRLFEEKEVWEGWEEEGGEGRGGEEDGPAFVGDPLEVQMFRASGRWQHHRNAMAR